MTRAALIPLGRRLFALALLGLGLEHFIFQEFVTGRAPAWPAGLPGKLMWVSGSGAIVVLAGLAIFVGYRWSRLAALVVALLIVAWAFARQLPIMVADSVLGGSWTRAGKALTIFGGTLAVAATLPSVSGAPMSGRNRFANSNGVSMLLGRVCLGSFLIVAGAQHFKFTAFAASLIPAWFPGNAIRWTRFAGVALIAGGVGLLFRRTAMAAGLLCGLMVFSWFWIVHLPLMLVSVSDGIAVFEALAVVGTALVIAGALDQPHHRSLYGVDLNDDLA